MSYTISQHDYMLMGPNKIYEGLSPHWKLKLHLSALLYFSASIYHNHFQFCCLFCIGIIKNQDHTKCTGSYLRTLVNSK